MRQTAHSPRTSAQKIRRWAFGYLLGAGGAVLFSGCVAGSRQTPEQLFARAGMPITPTHGSAWAAAERCAAAVAGDFALIGCGESMQPHLPPGAAIVVRPTSYFMLRPGMPVVYRSRSGAHVAHVIVRKSAAGWTALGLNNAEADEECVTPRNLVGVITRAFVASEPLPRGLRNDRVALGAPPRNFAPTPLLH